ncbi:CHAD domain-containing protein [Euryhalocaulis caribicus]|uniref:CHAD domain-containing protein n=1 Tax=Euryhalocaulis caribicus TaxID=1161401 RepID=UPI00039A25F0|nr:CHAD domain-containing protein [Euryhalocaulis caribicus]
MGYRFEPGETPEEGVKRIAGEQIGKTVADLRGPNPDAAAFAARKRLKKIRALFRLVREDMGKKAYRRNNAIFRDFGRVLSDLRDARAILESFDALLAHYGEQLEPGAFMTVRAELAQRHAAMTDWALDNRVLFEDLAEALEEARRPVGKISLKHKDFAAIRPGLKRTYRTALRRFSEAYKSGDAEAFHEWRKPLKALWLNVRLFKPVWNEALEDFGDYSKTLSNLTGEDHNLAVLRETILGEPAAFGGAASAEALAGLSRIRSRELRRKARPLGEALFAGPPSGFVDRMERYWDRL